MRTLLEQRLGVSELEKRLRELQRTDPGGQGNAGARIEELQRRVLELKDRAAATSDQVSQLRQTRGARRTKTLDALRHRWGAAALENSAMREEIAQHSRRVARLRRAEEVAKAAQDRKSARRASALLAREERRHQAAMATLLPEPSASAGTE